MSNIIKELCRIIYCGTKIICAALKKSISEEVKLSNEMAHIRYQTRKKAVAAGAEMSLEEAMKILNVNKLDKVQVERQYKHLYQANDKSQGGSFYIQSKVFRAKERIDS
ncbi:putative protein import into mitochondrial matrix [Trypoxylus dichotomus]